MDVNGWDDSGHNFLVCRNGLILVGRHTRLPAIKKGRLPPPPASAWDGHLGFPLDNPVIGARIIV